MTAGDNRKRSAPFTAKGADRYVRFPLLLTRL
jgi:hypothetical protein